MNERRETYRRQEDKNLVLKAEIDRNKSDLEKLAVRVERYKEQINGNFTRYERYVIGGLTSLALLLVSILATVLIYIANHWK